MQKSNNDNEIKKNIANEILKVASINADDIFKDKNAEVAILKRANTVLQNINDANLNSEEKKTKLKENIKSQAQELVAQIGRHSIYFSLDGLDIRTQDKQSLHKDCQKIADKLDPEKYNKLAKKALKFEKRKDERSVVTNVFYNTCIRTPQRILKLVKSKTYDKLSSVAETPFSKIAIGIAFIAAPMLFGISVPVMGFAGVCMLGGALILEGAKGLYDKWAGTNIEAESTKFQQSKLDTINVEKVLDINIPKQQNKAQDKGINTTPSYEYYKQNSTPSYEYYNAQQKLKKDSHHHHHVEDLKNSHLNKKSPSYERL